MKEQILWLMAVILAMEQESYDGENEEAPHYQKVWI